MGIIKQKKATQGIMVIKHAEGKQSDTERSDR